MTTTPKTEDSELDEILDIFGHTVINYGQYEGSRTRLKAGAAKRLKALIASQTQEAYKKGYIDGGIEMSSQVSAAENRLLDAISEELGVDNDGAGAVPHERLVSVIASHRPQTTEKEPS